MSLMFSAHPSCQGVMPIEGKPAPYLQCQPKETERLFLIGKMAACTLNEILPENHSYG